MLHALARILVLALALLPASSCVESEASKRVLRFTALPDQDTSALRQKFAPVAAWLSETLRIDVEYVPSTDYAASVQMFVNGDVQLAWFGGLAGLQARAAVPGARAIAQGAEDPEFYSYFIAHADTGIERSDEFPAGLAGRTFTFGDEASTSGRLMPDHFIREATGKAPDEFFSRVGFSKKHDKTARLVQAGTYEAGVLNYKTYDTMVAAGEIDPGVCRVVWKTPTYADYNLTAHPELDLRFGVGTVDRLQAALLKLEDEKLLAAFSRSRLIEASNQDFATLGAVAKQLGQLRDD